MNLTIRKIGNSEGIIIPKEVLTNLGLKNGDNVTLREISGGFQITQEKTDLAEQLRAARLGMQKYKVALRELAK